MKTGRLVARVWLGTTGVVAQVLGEGVYTTCALLMAALEEAKPARKQRSQEPPPEGPWWERAGLVKGGE